MKNVNDLTAEELKDLLFLAHMYMMVGKMDNNATAMERFGQLSAKLAKIIVAKEVEEDANNL